MLAAVAPASACLACQMRLGLVAEELNFAGLICFRIEKGELSFQCSFFAFWRVGPSNMKGQGRDCISDTHPASSSQVQLIT